MIEGKKLNVAVIGAGPGGLSTAYNLQQSGRCNVVVFEGSTHVGGRMSTRFRDGFAFDKGANFFVDAYSTTKAYAKLLDLPWEPMKDGGQHFTVRDGKLCLLTFKNLYSIFKFDALSYSSRAKLIWMFYDIGRKGRDLNFFDLTSLPPQLNTMSAYDYVEARAGKEVANYVIDAFTSMYQFHSAREISAAAMFALINMMRFDTKGFVRHHIAGGEMSTIPEALAKQLNVKLETPVDEIFTKNSKVIVRTGDNVHTFDLAVIATTANIAQRIYKNPTRIQSEFLYSVEYASTINISFRIPENLLEGIDCVAVSRLENRTICEYTNESMKGINAGGMTLINVGLHEGAADKLMWRENDHIYNLVRSELIKVCPNLHRLNPEILRPHDIQKWPSAMPKFSQNLMMHARELWRVGQGENGVYFAGDMTGCPWVEGALYSGTKVASMIANTYYSDIVFIK